MAEVYRTKTGRILTETDIEALVEEAERGYDVTNVKRVVRFGSVAEELRELIHGVIVAHTGLVRKPYTLSEEVVSALIDYSFVIERASDVDQG